MVYVGVEVNKNQSICQISLGLRGHNLSSVSSSVNYRPNENKHGVEQMENKTLASSLLKLVCRT